MIGQIIDPARFSRSEFLEARLKLVDEIGLEIFLEIDQLTSVATDQPFGRGGIERGDIDMWGIRRQLDRSAWHRGGVDRTTATEEKRGRDRQGRQRKETSKQGCETWHK